MAASEPATADVGAPNRWRVLAVLAVVQFMLYLDDTIVNVALPSIQADFDVSATALVWVVNAYVLMYGGLLLIAGRIGDLAGMRRVFTIGAGIFAAGSLANALAVSSDMLIASRAVQGVGAALTAPAALAIVVRSFRHPAERAKAVALWSALAGAGGAAGVVLSGVITEFVDWRWIFWVNVPIAIAAIAFVLREVSADPGRSGQTDLAGALLATGVPILFVYTVLETDRHGWFSLRTGLGLAAVLLLSVTLVLVERRSRSPLLALGFFRHRRRTYALVAQAVLAAVLFGVFFLGTLYLQQVLGYSPLEAGLAWLGFFAGFFLGYATGTKAVLALGVRPVMVAGLLLAGASLIWLATRISLATEYLTTLLPGMAAFGLALGWAFVPVLVALMSETEEREAGLAAGLGNSSYQIGGALGIAIFVALAESEAGRALQDGLSPAVAQVDGTQTAWVVGGLLCLATAVAGIALLGRLRPGELPVPAAIATDDPGPEYAGSRG